MRAFTALYINSNPERKESVGILAEIHATRILNTESWLGIAIEQRLQSFIITRCKGWIMTLLCDIYLAHITVGICFLGYGYT
jgi:hypothetical protein